MEPSDPTLIFSKSRLRAELEPLVKKAVEDALASLRPRGEDEKAWLTNEEACQYLGLSRATLARYRADGRLPYSKVGSSVFYKLEDVKALLEKSVV